MLLMRTIASAIAAMVIGVSAIPASCQSDIASRLADAAIERTAHRVIYDGTYRRLDYPGGDIPDSIGVCTDLVIRSYRAEGP